MAAPDLERVKKQLRSVLISEKGGVAADRLERDYRDLVSHFTSHHFCPLFVCILFGLVAIVFETFNGFF